MSRHGLLLALALTTPAAHAGLNACDIDSEYDLRVRQTQIEFTRHHGAPASVAMRDGRLFVDGHEAAVSADDAMRLRRFEREVRALVPEVKAIAVDAIDIAFTALTEVARTFSGDDAPALTRLDQARADLVAQVNEADGTDGFDDRFVERTVERLVGEVMPMVVGNIAAGAISAALSGDDAGLRDIEGRAARMERELEARVEREARALEARADALCPRLVRLADLDRSLEYRLADGRALDLVRMDRRMR